jgi:hypothetical protein
VFPALSTQLPLLLVPAVSGPPYVSCGLQEAIPEVVSEPLHWSETAERYQPALFGAVVAATLVDGAVAST